MFTPVQRGIAIGLLFSSFVCLAAFGTSTAVLTPLIDRPGTSAYCDAVAAAMEDASSSIDLLLSSADVTGVPLWDSVIAASDRGVSVRVLLDASDWAPDITADNRRVVSHLAEHGVECRFDDPGVTTHAKMVVIDRTVVVLGSSNWNEYAFREHEQANVMIENPQIGGVFTEYFDRLWETRLPVDGVEIAFDAARSDGPTIIPLPDGPETALYAALLLELLPRARRSVHVAMYRVSVYPSYPGSLANELVDGLISAARRGLDVRILIDDCRYYADSADANLVSAIYLYQHGIEVRFDGPEETTHAKLVVIDGESVVLGSTNWNYYSLEQNVEANVGLLRIPQVAEAFEAYFEILWEHGRPITP
jgi:phosphatidylserine/phosphatidylglycerophosphate/cardiolipin synthase-like enzyme